MLVQCPHCLKKQPQCDLEKHKETCPCRLISCPQGCGSKFLQRGLEKHLTICPVASGKSRKVDTSVDSDSGGGAEKGDMETCRHCDEDFPKSELADHERR